MHPVLPHSAPPLAPGTEVRRPDLEAQLAEVVVQAAGEREGLFGPASVTWRIDRESAVFLAAGRAALLQVAHPWVARALQEHSKILTDPIQRFHNTFRIIYKTVFGSRESAVAAARGLHRLHTGVRGQLPHGAGPFATGSDYAANDPDALQWVWATLLDSAVVAYELVLPPLTVEQREQYYAEGVRWAGLFGLEPERLPTDWSAFMAYNEKMWASQVLTVTPVARAMGQRILTGAGSWIRPPFWYRALTAEMLPPRLRAQFELPYGQAEQRATARARGWLPRIYRWLPALLRYVGPYREAQARIAGTRPGWTVAWSNGFWTGSDHPG